MKTKFQLTANRVNTLLAVVYISCLWLGLLGILVSLQVAFPIFSKSVLWYIPVFLLGIIFLKIKLLPNMCF